MAKQAKNMIKYIIKRILIMIPMLFFVLTFAFLLSLMMGRSPVTFSLDDLLEPEILEAELRRIGYYDPGMLDF